MTFCPRTSENWDFFTNVFISWFFSETFFPVTFLHRFVELYTLNYIKINYVSELGLWIKYRCLMFISNHDLGPTSRLPSSQFNVLHSFTFLCYRFIFCFDLLPL